MADSVKSVCEQWISAGYGEDCFWEDWYECPCEDSLTPNQVMAAVTKLEAERDQALARLDVLQRVVDATWNKAVETCARQLTASIIALKRLEDEYE